MRKLLSVFLVCFLLVTALPLEIFSDTIENKKVDMIYFEDGSYIIIELTQSNSRTSFAKAGEKKYTYYDNQNNAVWTAVLSGMFTYNGTTSTCKSSYCNVNILNNNWHEYSKNVSISGATTTCDLTMHYKLLGIKLDEKNVRITLTCDKDGNLS